MNMKKVKKVFGGGMKIFPGSSNESDEVKQQTLSANRASGDTIKDTLNSIPFHKNRIQNEEDPDFLASMKAMKAHFLTVLEKDTDPLSDDISAIDRKLQYAADAWCSAVTEGYYRKAKWSIAALNKGLKHFRTNIPRDKRELVDEVLKERLQQTEVYVSLIKNSEAIDKAEQTIRNATVLLNESTKEIEPIRAEIAEARQDPEKLKALAKIKALQIGKLSVTDLSEEEIALRDNINRGVVLARNIDMQRNNIEKAKTDLFTAQNMFAASRARLTIEDQKENEALLAMYKNVLSDMVKATMDALVYAEKARQEYLSYQNQIEAVWETPEGRNLLNDAVDFIDNTLLRANATSAVDIAIGMKEELNAEDTRKQENEDKLKDLFKNTQTNQNYNFNT